MGSQDTLEQAQSFVERHGTESPLMIWDGSFETWNFYSVSGQPQFILLDASGAEQDRWFGMSQEMLELLKTV